MPTPASNRPKHILRAPRHRATSRRRVALSAAALALVVSAGAVSTAIATGLPRAVSSTRVHIFKAKVGKILVTSKGRTIYFFAKDARNVSHCSAICLQYWPAVPAAQAPAPHAAGITAKFGVLKRSNGFKQLTINGYPAYTYVGDVHSGDMTGQGVNASGGRWWVVAPTGKRITTLPKASPSPTSSQASTSTSTPYPTYTYKVPA